MSYRFKKAAIATKGLDAEVVGTTLERIASMTGGLEPRHVVEEATPAHSPLHGYFEWDDRVAGQKFREEQAGYLIRAVVRIDDVTEEVRAFISVEEPREDDDESGAVRRATYRPVDVVMSNPEMRSRVLERALIDLRAWERKYRQLTELRDVIESANRTIKQLGFEM